MAEATKKVDESKATKPGADLKKVNSDAHKATYDKNGDLAIKHAKPVAAVIGHDRGTADTGASAKIQEPVSGTTVNPVDTVDEELTNTTPEHYEVRGTDDAGVKDGEETTASKNEQKEQEQTLEAVGADDTQAAKNSEESQKAEKARRKDDNASAKK